MPGYKVAVIIPVFNEWPLTAGCLRSLQEHTPRQDVQVIVVDNGSTDETPSVCAVLGRELFGQRFRYVRQEININFGPGCNLGAAHSQAEFLFFLNNDTILTKDWLEPLLAVFDSIPQCGAVGPLLLYPGEDRVQHLGVAFTPQMQVLHLYHQFPAAHRVVQKKRPLQAITGAAILLRASTFKQIGGFYEEYRNGYEDLDLCWQIRSLGLTLHVQPASRIYHLTSQSSGRFAAEDHNAQILLQRCQYGFVPDLHQFAVADGFTPQLSQTLETQLVYNRPVPASHALDVQSLWAAVHHEPLWREGYERLFELLSQQGRWEEALQLLQLQLCFFSDKKVYLHLAKVGTRLRNQQILSFCDAVLAAPGHEAISGGVLKSLASIKAWAREAKDEILLGLCHDWTSRFQPHQTR